MTIEDRGSSRSPRPRASILQTAVAMVFSAALSSLQLGSSGCGGCHEVLSFDGVNGPPESECLEVSVAQSEWRPGCEEPRLTISNGCTETFIVVGGLDGITALGAIDPERSATASVNLYDGSEIVGNLGSMSITMTISIVELE